MENLNLLFNKTFYTKLGDDTWFDERKKITVFDNDIAKKSKRLADSKFYSEDYNAVCSGIELNTFMLKTLYPGLLVGVGYAHGVDSTEDIKVGFSFDFVTGQPYIPGSSVKGLLRSYFAYPEVIRDFLADKPIDIKALETAIFGYGDDEGVDIFFDAVIRRGDKNGNVMGFDAITPHGDDLTKNPVPIKILKVLPDVVFEFSFKLEDSIIGDETVSAKDKEELFKNLLINFGIGAKTNVGYGVLTEYTEEELKNYVWPNRNARPASADRRDNRPVQPPRRENRPVEVDVIKGNEKPVEGKVYNCIITSVMDFGVFVLIEGTRHSGLIHISKLGVPRGENINGYFKKDQKVVAKFLGVNDKGKFSFGLVR